jgi:hypothetical protein
MHPLERFLWGFLGSVAVELINLVGFYSSERGRLPTRYRKVGFWVTRFTLAVMAGALSIAYAIDQRILAFNVGAATPLIITFMAKGLRQVPLDDDRPSSMPERVVLDLREKPAAGRTTRDTDTEAPV